MAGHGPGRSKDPVRNTPRPGGRFVPVEGGRLHVVEDGPPDAPAVLLIHGLAASTDCWDPVVDALAEKHRVIRVDMLGHGRSSSPAAGYETVAQAGRIGAALDALGVRRATVIGHSTGGVVATALAQQRPELLNALAVLDMGPSMAAQIPQSLLSRLLLAPFPGRLLWRMRSEATVLKAFSTGFTRPVEVPMDAMVGSVLGMTHRAVAGTARATVGFLAQQPLPERLAPLGLPVLVVFGAEDRRWRASSVDEYRHIPDVRVELLPGVGHTPMLEEPATTGRLLAEFAVAAAAGPAGAPAAADPARDGAVPRTPRTPVSPAGHPRDAEDR
ncbi:Lipase 3 precursor [Streptomyces sp. YIM 130001]|uniref:alpha/beta fold hydrolase n=1 Tax=Streptomyces sp. YIM 130001 TaxID=2259644 RepID=UPI000E652B29|nr:alpha/beta fold hydrolase [Streptomyces sp. YIM 130001]RII15785.1 Lipase 3 precursor [Streptomyces sp. YIM 130001]